MGTWLPDDQIAILTGGELVRVKLLRCAAD